MVSSTKGKLAYTSSTYDSPAGILLLSIHGLCSATAEWKHPPLRIGVWTLDRDKHQERGLLGIRLPLLLSVSRTSRQKFLPCRVKRAVQSVQVCAGGDSLAVARKETVFNGVAKFSKSRLLIACDGVFEQCLPFMYSVTMRSTRLCF
jgi:hypothetical protein